MSNIKVIEKSGKKPGKTMAILAGVHGNETCGMQAFEELIPNIKIESGKVFFISSNLKAMQENKRFIDCNLNRCFFKTLPKELEGVLEGKTSREIIPFLDQADALLDLHASNTSDSKPFIICEPRNFQMAEFFPISTVSYNWDSFEPGSTDYYMNLSKKPALSIECGCLGDQASTAIARESILNFLKYFGAIAGKPAQSSPKKYYKIISLYKNKTPEFIPARKFSDFEKLAEKTTVGYDGKDAVCGEAGGCVLFVRKRTQPSQECFLIARETNSKGFE